MRSCRLLQFVTLTTCCLVWQGPTLFVRGLFARKLASLLLEASKARSAASGAAEANGGAREPAAAPVDATSLDLTGEREFLAAESAQEALASMLAERSTVARVSSSPEPSRHTGRDDSGRWRGPLSSRRAGALLALACSRVASDDAQIKLSTKSFGAEAAGVAAGAIANCAASLTHADLSDVIAGRPEAEALDALRILSNALAQVGFWDK